MLPHKEVVEIISNAVADIRPPGADEAPITEETRLVGRGGILDSLGLVNLVVGVEEEINSRYGLTLSLADDRAMSQNRSPFGTVGRLAEYVIMLAGEVEVR